MARSRAIQAEFFDSEQLAKVSRDARLLFIGLWLIADHWGVLLNNPRKIMVAVFPYDDDGSPFKLTEPQFRQWLEDLFALRFILRFEYRGRKYIYIRSWEDHQTIQHREKQRHNATIPPDVLAGIVAELLDEKQPPLPNLAPSGRQNGKPIPNESGLNPDRIGNGSGSDTELSQGKLTVREGKLREDQEIPGDPVRVPISAGQAERDAVYHIERTEGVLVRFKNFLEKRPGSKTMKKTIKDVWHTQRFRAPSMRSLALEFVNSEQEPESGKGKGKRGEKSS